MFSKVYDFIFVSVPSGRIEDVIESLDNSQIRGTIILACGVWENRESLDTLMSGHDYLLGYPVAGGKCSSTHLEACVFDHFMIEKEEKLKFRIIQILKHYFQIVRFH